MPSARQGGEAHGETPRAVSALQAPDQSQVCETAELRRTQPENTLSNHMCRGGETSTTSTKAVVAKERQCRPVRRAHDTRGDLGPRRGPRPLRAGAR